MGRHIASHAGAWRPPNAPPKRSRDCSTLSCQSIPQTTATEPQRQCRSARPGCSLLFAFFSRPGSVSLTHTLSLPVARLRTRVASLLLCFVFREGPGLDAGKARGKRGRSQSYIPSHLNQPSAPLVFEFSDHGHSLRGTNRRWAFLHGTHADATCPLVFLCGLGGVLWRDSGMG